MNKLNQKPRVSPNFDERLVESIVGEESMRLFKAAPELLSALRDFVSYGSCRMANQSERNMAADKFKELAIKYNPILDSLGVSPFQMSQVDFDTLNEAK